MKKKLLKATVLTLCAVALVVGSVLATIAYLTASTAVSNTFTVGNIKIAMYESKVDADGKKVADTDLHGAMKDSDGNNYHLLPGKTYDKDPTIYIDATSDKSYVFVKVRNNISDVEYGNFIHADGSKADPDTNKPTMAEQMAAYGWQYYLHTATGDVYVYVGNVDNTVGVNGVTNGNKLTGTALDAVINKTAKPAEVGGIGAEQVFNVFDTFSIDEHANLTVYGGAKVTLTAFAIQTTGFVDDPDTADKNEALDAAWAEIVNTYPYEDGASQ